MKIQIEFALVLVVFCGLSAARNNVDKLVDVIVPTITESAYLGHDLPQQLFGAFLPLAIDNLGKFRPGQERLPVIPIIPDQIRLKDLNFTVNITDFLLGDLAFWNHSIHGLGGLRDSLGIKLVCEPAIGIAVSMDVYLPSLYIRGDGYDADLEMFASKFIGTGAFRAGILNTSFHLGFHIGFRNVDQFKISGLKVALELGGLDLFAENMEVDGTQFTEEMFKTLSENLVPLINQVVPAIVDPLLPNITNTLNEVIGDCRIVHIIRFILGLDDLTCLKLPTTPVPWYMWSPKYEIVDPVPNSVDFSKSIYTDMLPFLISQAEEAGVIRDLAISFLTTTLKGLEKVDTNLFIPGESEGRIPIFPDLPDPLFLNTTNLPLNLGFLTTNMSVEEGIIEGLRTIDDDLLFRIHFDPFGIVFNFSLARPERNFSVIFNGTHTSEVNLVLPPLSPFALIQGDGDFKMGVKEAEFQIGLHVGLQPNSFNIKIRDLMMHIAFKEIVLSFENFYIGDCRKPIPVYWQGVSDTIKLVFDIIWGVGKTGIVQLLETALNNIIKNCTILEIIDIIRGGDASCLGSPFPPAPTTTARPAPTTTTARPAPTTTTARPTTITTTRAPYTGEPTTNPPVTNPPPTSAPPVTNAPPTSAPPVTNAPPADGAVSLKSMSFALLTISSVLIVSLSYLRY